jgi:hypothetical protein
MKTKLGAAWHPYCCSNLKSDNIIAALSNRLIGLSI